MSSMRDQMPQCAAFIDSLRATFGEADINAAIKKQMRDGTFYAREAGHVIGVAPVVAPKTKKVKHACTVCGAEALTRVGVKWFCYDHYRK